MNKIKLPYDKNFKLVYVDKNNVVIPLEPTNEVRSPKLGEYFLASDATETKAVTCFVSRTNEGNLICGMYNGTATFEATRTAAEAATIRLILKPAWCWPKWLKADYAFSLPTGDWFCSNIKPMLLDGEWTFPTKVGGNITNCIPLHEAILSYASAQLQQKRMDAADSNKIKFKTVSFDEDDELDPNWSVDWDDFDENDEPPEAFKRKKARPELKVDAIDVDRVLTDKAYILPLNNRTFDFLPPDTVSWQDSLIENPNLENMRSVKDCVSHGSRRLLKDK